MTRLRSAQEITDLPDYILALIWFTASISGDAILIRHKRAEIPDTIATAIRGSSWTRENGSRVLKLHSPSLITALTSLGFTGKKDLARTPPPVDPLPFAKALTETHSTLGYALNYDRHYPRDKAHAYYTPSVSLCSAPAIVETYARALSCLGIAPLKLSSPAANGKSMIYRITSRTQLAAAHRLLSPEIAGHGMIDFWQRFETHATAPTIPYNTYHTQE